MHCNDELRNRLRVFCEGWRRNASVRTGDVMAWGLRKGCDDTRCRRRFTLPIEDRAPKCKGLPALKQSK
eukprot:5617261-Alexandrium_andersonii.AAC.1